MLDQVFMQVLDMNRTASVVILIVLLVRLGLKRFPKYISYALWSVVLFRLLCPISLESVISIIPNMTPTVYHYSLVNEDFSIIEVRDVTHQIIEDVFIERNDEEHMQKTENTVDEIGTDVVFTWQDLLIYWGKYVWLAGISVLLVYNIISYVRIRKKTATAIPIRENIYCVDGPISPFVMGMFRPKIYLPSGLTTPEQEFIVLHEQIHIKRFDYIIKPLAFILLCVHWFNPMVWVAFMFSSKDMEMSCDEAVVKRLGEKIKVDYSETLLSLTSGTQMIRGLLLAFGKGDTKGRIKNMANMKKYNKSTLLIVIMAITILALCLVTNPKHFQSNEQDIENEKELIVSIDIEEHYITKTGDPANLYYIDDNNVLWGCGRNNAGQLGQGTQDYEFHDEMIKIAEDVIHVDYSQRDFVIYLTSDHKLYGMGNAGSGALQQYEEFEWDKYISPNYEHYYVSEPVLLMENVTYARCGQADVACLTENGDVWIWGTVCINGGYTSDEVYFIAKPRKVLENAILITGGWFNHAALLQDGTVWTWGYNFAGNCGVADESVVTEPTMVADNVVMVWTGSVEYNVDLNDISDFEGEYPRYMENTIIKKADGSYLICGANVGDREKTIPFYFETTDYQMICTHEFYPYEFGEIE